MARRATRARPRPRSARSPLGAAGIALCALLLAPGSAAAKLEIRATKLEPDFRPRIHDYTTSCAKRTKVAVRTGSARARIGRGKWFRGGDRRRIRLREGQAIEVAVRRVGGKRDRYLIRCLPKGFPSYDFRRSSKPRHSVYVMSATHTRTLANIPRRDYAFVIDSRGTPVWWMQASPQAIDTKVLPDGTVAWATWYGGTYATDPRSRYEIRSLDGKVVRKLQAVGSPTDHHELQELANGNYMITSYRPRSGVNALAFNGDLDATVLDAVVQEITPRGKLVYEWSSEDHVALAETGRWWTYTFGAEPYDHTHLNAVDPLPGGDFLISLHNTDAVYRIDRETGNVVWKLGGTPTPESLRVIGDSESYTLAGQHDGRSLGGGAVSVFDNGTLLRNFPRVVRFRIDGSTARLVEDVRDSRIPYSNCCGSATRGRDGSWLIAWGGTRFVTEVDRRDRRTFTLEFSPDHFFTYRVHAVDDLVSLRKLRAGMSAMVPDAR